MRAGRVCFLAFGLVMLAGIGCKSAYYAAWEKVGVYKRDLLKKKVTAARYGSLHGVLKRAEQSMDPVLVQFRDHVLFLKHNLNAQAIGSLKGEAVSIQSEIASLIGEMNAAIARADEFIEALP